MKRRLRHLLRSASEAAYLCSILAAIVLMDVDPNVAVSAGPVHAPVTKAVGAPANSPASGLAGSGAPRAVSAQACPENAGLVLPPGFCATVFAEDLGHARHLVVASNGVVYVNTRIGSRDPSVDSHAEGHLFALEDTHGTGHADVRKRFGETGPGGGAGGTGIRLHGKFLYVEAGDRIVRYALTPGSIVPQPHPQVVVSGLPLGGDHPMHPFVIDDKGNLYVDSASATNACQAENRAPQSPGLSPCLELRTRGGIWRFDANKLHQTFSPAARFATGIRNAEGLEIDPEDHALYATQHGRDQLGQNWSQLYSEAQGAVLPAEELLRVAAGSDSGWPECYFDPARGKLVLAPEYGGDGGHAVGACAGKNAPVAAFPAHWAPDDLLLTMGSRFPAPYDSGALLAFHGSWNRAPFAQGGYDIVYQPLDHGNAAGQCVIFADGFAGTGKAAGAADHRPTGLALGPDGALYVADDRGGRVYRIYHRPSPSNVMGQRDSAPVAASGSDGADDVHDAHDAHGPSSGLGVAPCPDPVAPPEKLAAE